MSFSRDFSKSSETVSQRNFEPPLQHHWIFYYDEKTAKGLQRDRYKSSLRKLGEVATISDFWRYTNNIDVSNLPSSCNLRMFKSGIEPTWEDPSNQNGGKWSFEVPNGFSLKEVWTICLLSLIGEQFSHSDTICGAVLSVRGRNGTTINIWNKSAYDMNHIKECEEDIKKIILKKLAEIKQQPVSIELRYQPHHQSLEWNHLWTVSKSKENVLASLASGTDQIIKKQMTIDQNGETIPEINLKSSHGSLNSSSGSITRERSAKSNTPRGTASPNGSFSQAYITQSNTSKISKSSSGEIPKIDLSFKKAVTNHSGSWNELPSFDSPRIDQSLSRSSSGHSHRTFDSEDDEMYNQGGFGTPRSDTGDDMRSPFLQLDEIAKKPQQNVASSMNESSISPRQQSLHHSSKKKKRSSVTVIETLTSSSSPDPQSPLRNVLQTSNSGSSIGNHSTAPLQSSFHSSGSPRGAGRGLSRLTYSSGDLRVSFPSNIEHHSQNNQDNTSNTDTDGWISLNYLTSDTHSTNFGSDSSPLQSPRNISTPTTSHENHTHENHHLSEWWLRRIYRKRGRPSSQEQSANHQSQASVSTTQTLPASKLQPQHLTSNHTSSAISLSNTKRISEEGVSTTKLSTSPTNEMSGTNSDSSHENENGQLLNLSPNTSVSSLVAVTTSTGKRKRKRPSRGGSRDKTRALNNPNSSESTTQTSTLHLPSPIKDNNNTEKIIKLSNSNSNTPTPPQSSTPINSQDLHEAERNELSASPTSESSDPEIVIHPDYPAVLLHLDNMNIHAHQRNLQPIPEDQPNAPSSNSPKNSSLNANSSLHPSNLPTELSESSQENDKIHHRRKKSRGRSKKHGVERMEKSRCTSKTWLEAIPLILVFILISVFCYHVEKIRTSSQSNSLNGQMYSRQLRPKL